MQLDMRPDVFDAAASLPSILNLLTCVRDGRHVWIVDDSDFPTIETYLRKHLPYLADAYIGLARKGMVEVQWVGSLEKPTLIQINAQNLDELAHDLSRPGIIGVEDRTSDGSFLRTLCQVFGAERLLEALSHGWLELRHGGGGALASVAEAEIVNFRHRVRVAVLFDSDRLVPGERTHAHANAARLSAQGAVIHVLELREIENYIPNRVLAALRPFRISSRRLHFLKLLTPAQRGVYDMKHGFGPASARPVVPSRQVALFGYLPADTLRGLRSGFGKNIVLRMADMAASLTEDDFRSLGDSVVSEITTLLRKLASIV